MRYRRRIGHRLVTIGCSIAASCALAPTAIAGGPLATAIWHPGSELGLQRVKGAGATTVAVPLHWRSIAPATRPADFNPTDAFDPAYRWEGFDTSIARVVALRLTPLISIYFAPDWAEGPRQGHHPAGTAQPDPAQLGQFAKAAAERYSGRNPGLPRIRHWQIWAEPNLNHVLNPQRVGNKPFSPHWYRRMLNAAAAAIHSVHRDNVVVTGGLGPFTPRAAYQGMGPLHFMRLMLCVSKELKRTCKQRSHFDVWAHHPFTSGGPTHHAYSPDDVSLGDLPEMRRLLMAAYRNGSIVARTPPKFWVTEFGWDSRPPDPNGVPLKLHARWVAEALYRMWASGVNLVTWVQLRDEGLPSLFQGGLYLRGSTIEEDRPKPALQAFRFPFVGFPRRGGVYVWGRTPAGQRGRVIVEQSFSGGWRRLGVLRTNRHGIFEHRFRSRPVGWVRARSLTTRDAARPFSLKHHPDRFFNPFGLPTRIEPGTRQRP